MLDALLTPEDPVPGEITNREHERDQGFSLFILVKRNQSNIFPMALQCPKKCLGVVYIYTSLLDLAALGLVVHISGSDLPPRLLPMMSRYISCWWVWGVKWVFWREFFLQLRSIFNLD